MARAAFEKYALQARFLKALAHALRLAVLRTLRRGEKCVSDIAQEVSCGQSSISRHLSRMEWAGILSHRKEGLQVYYGLTSPLPCICTFLTCVVRNARRAHRIMLVKMDNMSGGGKVCIGMSPGDVPGTESARPRSHT